MRCTAKLIPALGSVFALTLAACGGLDPTLDADARAHEAPLRALDAEEADFLRVLNAYRAENALPALTATPLLNQVAYDHSADMARRRYFDHTNPEGLSPFDRMAAAGYRGGAMAENIAAGNSAGAATFTQWRGSPGHDTNMRGPRYRAIGIGRAYDAASPYRWYWTTVFGDVVDASAQGPLADGGTSATPDAGASVRDGGTPTTPDAGTPVRDGGTPTAPDAGVPASCLGGRNEVEPNDRSTTANALVGAACGRLGTATDQDWFTFTARVGSPYAVTLQVTGNARLELWRSSSSGWLYVRSGTSASSTAASSSRYLLRVRSSTGARQSYVLTRTR